MIEDWPFNICFFGDSPLDNEVRVEVLIGEGFAGVDVLVGDDLIDLGSFFIFNELPLLFVRAHDVQVYFIKITLIV